MTSPKASTAADVSTSTDKQPARTPATKLRDASAPGGVVAFKPLKPQKKLFVGLLLLLAIWIAILLTLFFTTVYPRLHTLH